MAMWLKVKNSSHEGTVLSYLYTNHNNETDVVGLLTGPSLTLKLPGQSIITKLVFNSSVWFHLAWTWTSKGKGLRVRDGWGIGEFK